MVQGEGQTSWAGVRVRMTSGYYIIVLLIFENDESRRVAESRLHVVVDTWQTKGQRSGRNPQISWVCRAIFSLPNRVISMPYRSTLFVSNLPYTATSTDLKTLFSDIAPVRSAFVVLEHGTDASKGVGYVSFAIPEDAKAAFDSASTDGITLDG